MSQASNFEPAFGANVPTALLAAALILATCVVAKRLMVIAVLRMFSRPGSERSADPRPAISPSSVHQVERPDGTVIHVECFGPADGRPIVCTHGWGLSSLEWNYLKREIPTGYRLILWDLPGLGKSRQPRDRNFSLVKLAADLAAVVDFAGKPPILVGHSIGGMIMLTLMGAAFRDTKPLCGLVLVHTTPTNPVRTTSGAAFLSALQKPVLEPLLHLTVVLSPFIRFLNWLAYFNGSVHLQNRQSSLGGRPTWQQVDFASRFLPRAFPAVLARGILGMLRYDALGTLEAIRVPTLVISGNRDSTTKPDASAAMQGSKLLELSPAKHLGLIEHHERFGRALCDFLHSLKFVGEDVETGLIGTTLPCHSTARFVSAV